VLILGDNYISIASILVAGLNPFKKYVSQLWLKKIPKQKNLRNHLPHGIFFCCKSKDLNPSFFGVELHKIAARASLVLAPPFHTKLTCEALALGKSLRDGSQHGSKRDIWEFCWGNTWMSQEVSTL